THVALGGCVGDAAGLPAFSAIGEVGAGVRLAAIGVAARRGRVAVGETCIARPNLAGRCNARGLSIGDDARRPAGLAIVGVAGEVDLAPIAGIAVAIAEPRRTVADPAFAVFAPRRAVLPVTNLPAPTAVGNVFGGVRLAPVVAAVTIGEAVGAGDLA